MDNNIIAEFQRGGFSYHVVKHHTELVDRYTIDNGLRCTQVNLTSDEIIRWFANGMNEIVPKVMHVVMGNDFPEAVFDSLTAAEAFCIEKRKEGPFNPSGSNRIHWRVYDFKLNDEAKPA